MAMLSLAQLIGAWEPVGRGSPHRRLSRLLAAIDGADAGRDETVGDRNRRLLRLHRDLIGAPIDARVTCAHCGVDSEFVVPADDILALPAPDPRLRVEIAAGTRVLAFRLPRIADLDAAAGASGVEDVRRTIVERCLLTPDEAPDVVPAAVADELGTRLDGLDPAANIVLDVACAGCGRPMAASVDLATFVARDLDRFVESVFHDIHIIAAAYGWDEATILALPRARRQRYVSMIAGVRAHEAPRQIGRAR